MSIFVERITSVLQNNSLQEAVKTKESSEFKFNGTLRNNGILTVKVTYNSGVYKAVIVELPKQDIASSTNKEIFLEQLSTSMSNLGFKNTDLKLDIGNNSFTEVDSQEFPEEKYISKLMIPLVDVYGNKCNLGFNFVNGNYKVWLTTSEGIIKSLSSLVDIPNTGISETIEFVKENLLFFISDEQDEQKVKENIQSFLKECKSSYKFVNSSDESSKKKVVPVKEVVVEKKKATLATLKSFLKKNEETVFIKVTSDYDAQVDGFDHKSNAQWRKLEKDTYKDERLGFRNNLGYNGIWCVGDSRDYISSYSDSVYTGFEILNSCGSFIVGVKK